MKIIITGIMAVLLSACSVNADTTLSFGAEFKLKVRQSLMDGSTVFASDELSVKTANDQLISGKLLSVDSEKLPQSFNIQQYPDYLPNLLHSKYCRSLEPCLPGKHCRYPISQ